MLRRKLVLLRVLMVNALVVAFCCFFVYLFLIILSTFNSQLCVAYFSETYYYIQFVLDQWFSTFLVEPNPKATFLWHHKPFSHICIKESKLAVDHSMCRTSAVTPGPCWQNPRAHFISFYMFWEGYPSAWLIFEVPSFKVIYNYNK